MNLISRKLIMAGIFFVVASVSAQDTKDDVHLFQAFSRDATISSTGYGEAIIDFNNNEFISSVNLGARGGYPINDNIEIGGGFGFTRLDIDNSIADDQSGLTDLRLVGKYHIDLNAPTKLIAGATFTLPIGSDDIRQGEANLGVFGSVRHPVSETFVLTGTLGFEFVEGASFESGGWPTLSASGPLDRELGLVLGGGGIFALDSQIHLITELLLATEGDIALFSAGVDYSMPTGGNLRGALGFGLDDGSPDFTIFASYLLSLN